MKPSAIPALGILFIVFAASAFSQQENSESRMEEAQSEWDGSQTTPVHLLPLVDELGQQIVPDYHYPMPLSTENTCLPCHKYSTISAGWHFNSSKDTVEPGRKGEPWIWVDRLTGTQLPLSYREWDNAWDPEALGITQWEFTKQFGRHLPGGDMAEPEGIPVDPHARWTLSGKIQVNCFACHNGSPRQDQGEWAKQIGRENFRWAATAASGLAEVGGMASRMHDTWDVYDGINPDDTEYAVPPNVNYDLALFDSKGRAWLDIEYRPLDQRCLYCHSASPVDKSRWEVQQDVHTAAGMQCVDCHRNGIDHMMIRGYKGEAELKQDGTVAAFSCEGCHMGTAEGADVSEFQGHSGAPYPQHKGIPPVHFEKLTCTVCHSGPWPEAKPVRIRTSRANRLGIHGRAQWFTEPPYIVEPVFVQQEDGRVAPHRMMWPAYWGALKGDKVTPLEPLDVEPVATGILNAQEQVGRVLSALALDQITPGTPVFLTPGKLYRVNIDGKLDVEDYAGTTTVNFKLWAREVDGRVDPLVPDFDHTADPIDFNVETRILYTLQALGQDPEARGVPVVLKGGKMYRRTFAGLLEASDNPAEFADSPQLGWLQPDDEIIPLARDFVVRAIAQTVGEEQSMTEEQVALMLQKLAQSDLQQKYEADEFVYIGSGNLFHLDGERALKAEEHPAAAPTSWPFGHNVRPAQQSLGVASCMDCHSPDASYFFSEIAAFGPLKTDNVSVAVMHDLQQLDGEFQRRFGRSFFWRPAFKVALVVVSVLLISILLLYWLSALQRMLNWIGGKD